MFILASSSPTRQALLRNAGLTFTSVTPDLEETILHAKHVGLPPNRLALMLAVEKSKTVSAVYKDQLIVGADQILHLDQRTIHKPKTVDEARTMLQILRGKTHYLTTAVSCHVNQNQIWHYQDQTIMTMRKFSDAFLENYLLRNVSNTLASAGAYQLEAEGIQIFEKIEGDYFTILGFPLLAFLNFLRNRKLLES